jgi:alkylation response protein AidB-like acyl-CoA dehydrogenase
MHLAFNPDELAFRDEVRAFLGDALPADIRKRVHLGDHSRINEDITSWQKILHARGWGAPAWPVEFGGPG